MEEQEKEQEESLQWSEEDFLREMSARMAERKPVELLGRTVVITAVVRLKRQERLHIRGPGTIRGDCHSLFQIDSTKNHQALVLEQLRLEHTCESEGEFLLDWGAGKNLFSFFHLFFVLKIRARLERRCF
jgi:hypothetical protein